MIRRHGARRGFLVARAHRARILGRSNAGDEDGSGGTAKPYSALELMSPLITAAPHVRGLAAILFLGNLCACGQEPGNDFQEKTPENIERALRPVPGGKSFASEAELLDFVFQKPKVEDYRPYARGVPRADLPMRPADLDEPVRITIDAATAKGIYPSIHDEVNVWKSYAMFRPEAKLADRFGDGFLNRWAPWWIWARVPAALGGNYPADAAASCDARKHDASHDIDPSWECGDPSGKLGPAALLEPVKMGADGQAIYDFTQLKLAYYNMIRAGLYPHLNLSSAHSVFTGGKSTLKWYHWNEEPVRDYEAWGGFVEAAMRAFDNPTLPFWRFSIVNEPNCIRGEGSKLFKVGYKGSPVDYAKQYVTTARAIRKVLPEARFQVGNYVVSDLMPEEKNLHLYLAALRDELAQHPGLGWDDATFYSCSIYDVPHKTIYGADAEKFGQLERYREAVGLKRLPMKIDEYDIHPDVILDYDQKHKAPIYSTAHAASWMAKAFKVFRSHGVRSAAGWCGQVFFQHGGGKTWEPFPRYFVMLMDSLLAGRVAVSDQPGNIPALRRLEPGAADPAYLELEVSGTLLPEHRGEGYSYRSVEATATRDPGAKVFRMMVFHHTTVLASDEDTAADPRPAQVELRVKGLPFGAYDVRAYGVGVPLEGNGKAEAWIRWDADKRAARPWTPIYRGEAIVSAGLESLRLHPGGAQGTFPLARYAVIYFELERRL
jgi:hypothetical protein